MGSHSTVYEDSERHTRSIQLDARGTALATVQSALDTEADEHPITSPTRDATVAETVEAPPVGNEETPAPVIDLTTQSVTDDDDEVELVNITYPTLPLRPTKRRRCEKPSTSKDGVVVPGAAATVALKYSLKSLYEDDLNEKQPETSIYPTKHAEIGCQTGGTVSFDAETQTDLKRKYEDEDEDGMTCPICFETWDRGGEHRLVAINCGHLFGESCVKNWLKTLQIKDYCCPLCKTRCQVQDIWPIFARKVCYTDSTAVSRLQNQIVQLSQRNSALEEQLERERKLRRKIGLA